MLSIVTEVEASGQLTKVCQTRDAASTVAAMIHQCGIDAKITKNRVIVTYRHILDNPRANFTRFCNALVLTGFKAS